MDRLELVDRLLSCLERPDDAEIEAIEDLSTHILTYFIELKKQWGDDPYFLTQLVKNKSGNLFTSHDIFGITNVLRSVLVTEDSVAPEELNSEYAVVDWWEGGVVFTEQDYETAIERAKMAAEGKSTPILVYRLIAEVREVREVLVEEVGK